MNKQSPNKLLQTYWNIKYDSQIVFQNIERFFEDLFHEKISGWTFWATCTYGASKNTCTYEGLKEGLRAFIPYLTKMMRACLALEYKSQAWKITKVIHSATNKFQDSNHIGVPSSAIYVFRPAFESCDIPLSGNTSFASIG